jgi:hypothetical protein
MAAFSPQPEGPGAIFPISASIVVSRHPVCVTPHFWNSKKLTPGATAPVVGTGPNKLQGFENIYMGGGGGIN